MEDKEYPESNVTSEVVSNHKPPQTIETQYKKTHARREKVKGQTLRCKTLAQTRKILTIDYEHKKTYTRKDSVLVVNSPFNARTSEDVT